MEGAGFEADDVIASLALEVTPPNPYLAALPSFARVLKLLRPRGLASGIVDQKISLHRWLIYDHGLDLSSTGCDVSRYGAERNLDRCDSAE